MENLSSVRELLFGFKTRRWILSALSLLCIHFGCRSGGMSETIGDPNEVASQAEWFHEVAAEKGIKFIHRDGRSGQRFYVETAASGGGWIDYDHDGDLDVYLINGAKTPGSIIEEIPRNHLFENRNGLFVDVTEHAGVGDRGYGMGMCVGDFDADGFLDIFVSNFGRDRMYRNTGKGQFEEVSEQVGLAGDRWGTSCAFGDLDGDGDLDLYVANYADFRFEHNPRCGDEAQGLWSYCRPARFDGQTDYLYINNGEGKFEDQSLKRGISIDHDDRGFGVVLSDIDDDGDLDILVANDGSANRLYINNGNGFFDDRGLASGFGYNRNGQAESGMGLCLGDTNGDGLMDPAVSNYSFETNTLYLNRGSLFFEDSTSWTGMADMSYLPVGWGIQYLDYDSDGDLDLAVVNGHVMDNIDQFETGIGYPQSNHLLENDGSGHFDDVSAQAGPAFGAKKVSRALAVGDWNNDGRPDLLVTNTNDHPDLIENLVKSQNHWLGLELKGPAINPFAIGARVTLSRNSNRLGIREVRSGGGFMAQDDLRPLFGLGREPGPVTIQIRWPDGRLQNEIIQKVDRYLRIQYRPESNSKKDSE